MISGGIKYFDQNKALLDFGTTITASSATASANFAIDRNPFTFWRSVGSSDSVTETLIITFDTSVTLDRIHLVDHNFKSFTIKYDLASVFTDFTTVIGLDGALGGGITEATFTDGTAYYEFDQVTTTRIEIAITLTQVVDAEKFISQIIATTELGTFVGFPILKSITESRNSRVKKMLSGRSNVAKSLETASFRLDFKNYPPGLTADLDLAFALFDREAPFLVWLSGGRRGTDFFTYTLRGFRLKDILQMQVGRDFKVSYSKNVYLIQVNLQLSLVEHV